MVRKFQHIQPEFWINLEKFMMKQRRWSKYTSRLYTINSAAVC